ncbi:MAG: hypothetical protein ACRYGK_00865 [Janthinobacterium lividum]
METTAIQTAPLSPQFLQWWFEPWEYAQPWPGDMALPQGLVGRRDGYAMWCRQAGVQADFPNRIEGLWQAAAIGEAALLEQVATLFAGLLAARENDLKALQGLDAAQRRWCMSVAALQPLLSLASGTLADGTRASLLQRGLLEIRAWLDSGFAGMWSRLRHVLPIETASELDLQPAAARPAGELSAAAIKRAQRCWQLCTDRAQATLEEETFDADNSGSSFDKAMTAPRNPVSAAMRQSAPFPANRNSTGIR